MDAIITMLAGSVGVLVSIHAPVMDAMLWLQRYDTYQSFNPRARDGRDKQMQQFELITVFQSTRP